MPVPAVPHGPLEAPLLVGERLAAVIVTTPGAVTFIAEVTGSSVLEVSTPVASVLCGLYKPGPWEVKRVAPPFFELCRLERGEMYSIVNIPEGDERWGLLGRDPAVRMECAHRGLPRKGVPRPLMLLHVAPLVGTVGKLRGSVPEGTVH